ncbi:MAG: ABC transporter ATP-binding protein [Candidatus Aenigmatarchaeota archaeon]
MRVIEVDNVSVIPENSKHAVIRDVTFGVNSGEFLGIVGPSGCGKSTLLRIMAGVERPTYGEVLFNGQQFTEPQKEIAIVFQHSALLPWKTMLQNIELPLEARGMDADTARGIALKFVKKVGLVGYENSYPRETSEGIRHTTSLARALAVNPIVVLMDQPFSSLDAFSADRLRRLTLDIWKASENKTSTFVLVTHSVEEAVSMCDRILVMSHMPGHILKEIKIDMTRPREDHMRDEKFFAYCDEIKEMMNPKFHLNPKNGHSPKNG